MCRAQNCENCQQKQNPTPQQISPFPQCQSHKTVNSPDESLSYSFFLFSQINCQQILMNFNSVTFVGEPFKAQTTWRNIDIRRDSRKCYNIFPQQRTCSWKFQRAANGLRHSSKTCLLDCSILNEDFFIPLETTEAFLERSAADFSSVAAFKVHKIRKMKNDTVGKPSSLLLRKIDTLSLQPCFFFQTFCPQECFISESWCYLTKLCTKCVSCLVQCPMSNQHIKKCFH